MTRPYRLAEGGFVALLSLSSTPVKFPRRWKRAIAGLAEKNLQAHSDWCPQRDWFGQGGSAKQRTEDLEGAVQDSTVHAIISTTGGFTAADLLPLLDFAKVGNGRKVICGFSDMTALLNAITSQTGLLTFYGPALLPCFGEVGGVHPYTFDNFANVVMASASPGQLNPPVASSAEFLYWDRDDIRPRRQLATSAWKAFGKGRADGLLIGGHLESFAALLDTPYFSYRDNQLVFLETESPDEDARRVLDNLKERGIFERAAGLVWGRQWPSEGPGSLVKEFLQAVGVEQGTPVLYDVDFGHTQARLTLPIGGRAIVCADSGTLTLPDSYVS